MSIQSLSKSSSGNLHNSGIIVGTEDGRVSLYDIYANKLTEIQLSSPFRTLSTSIAYDDMYFIATLQNLSICEFNVTLEKKFKINSMNS
jgi:hypothetical protein